MIVTEPEGDQAVRVPGRGGEPHVCPGYTHPWSPASQQG